MAEDFALSGLEGVALSGLGGELGVLGGAAQSLKLDNLSVTTTNLEGNTKTEEAEAVNNTLTAPLCILKKYGIIQDIVFKSKKEDSLLKAKRILNENCKPKETIEVECIGDINYRVGFGVHLVAPFLKGYEDCFMYIKEVEHEWKSNSLFISKLTLTPSRVMDEVEWTDLDEDSEAESSASGTALWEKIYAVLKQQEGKPYVYGAKGPDSFDCSGLVYYCYNQFKDELGITLGGDTYSQCKQGSEVDKGNKDSWEPGDLLFWKGDGSYPEPAHVSIYIGDNKMIHAPKHNDVVKTVDVTRTDIYCVRRVIPESTSSDSSGSNSSDVNLSNTTKMTMKLSFYTGAANEGGSQSASGKPLEYGMCASNVHPFGTKFYIKGINGLNHGIFTVEDRGGSDFNAADRLDIYIGNGSDAKTKANNLGRQTCMAYKLKG